MRIVIAPDSFKGSISAVDVANAMERGVKTVFPDAEVFKVPIADGGEGTVRALVGATGGEIIEQKVMGPLGEVVTAFWGILGNRETAVIEMAAASGLPLVPVEKRNPLITTTYGTGELIKAVLDRGIRNLIIGIGGSATNDGGSGMAKALGVKFLGADGLEIPDGGGALSRLDKIDIKGIDPRLSELTIMVACDVDNPLCGERGASAVYGPQKGATSDMVKELDDALAVYAAAAKKVTGRDVANVSGAGAAGGLGAGLLFFSQARLRPGVEIVLETTGFVDLVENADLVITGEGRTDVQTSYGKAPVGVAKIAKHHNVPVVCISGGLAKGAEDVLNHGIDAVASIVPQPMTLEECIRGGAPMVEDATERVLRLIRVGMNIDRVDMKG